MSDIVWYRFKKGVGCYAVLPEHPGDPRGETCFAFEPMSGKPPSWWLITTTPAVVLRATRDAWHHEAEPLRLWLAKQGYDVEPRRFSLVEARRTREARAREEFHGIQRGFP